MSAADVTRCLLHGAADVKNPYLWCSLGWLEFKAGKNITRARSCFEAATCADRQHACAYHMWGTLERSQGNYTAARDKWMQVRA